MHSRTYPWPLPGDPDWVPASEEAVPHWIYDPLSKPRAYYHSMAAIGPRFTREARHAAVFGSRHDAEECALSFSPLILWEVEVACVCSRSGGKGLCPGCQAEYDAAAAKEMPPAGSVRGLIFTEIFATAKRCSGHE